MPLSPSAPGLPLEEGLEHLRARRYDKAIVALRLALQREPGRLAVVRALATAYLHDEDPAEARRTLETFTQNSPMVAEGWMLASQLEWKLGDRPRAIEVLQSGLQKLPKSESLNRQVAVFLAAEGKLAEAAEHAELSDRCGPLAGYVAAANGRVAALFQSDSTGISRNLDQDWLDQIAADPALVTALLVPSSDATDTSAMLRGVEQRLAKLLESQPHHADRQLLLARLQVAIGDLPAAIFSIERSLACNPNLLPAHRLRADIHASMGEFDKAIEILRQLLKRGLAWPDIQYQIAVLEKQSVVSSQ
jgi:predicted Zn-dependent protease